MTVSFVEHAWKRSFGDALPAGFLAREAIPDCWLRIHSLPDSKRYAQSSMERMELLMRQNSVASYALGEGNTCWLFFARFSESRQWPELESLPLSGLLPAHVFSAGTPDEPIQFFAAQVTWRANAFDDLISASAEDQTGPILFANLSSRSAYAPYDGGADLFLSSTAAVSAARSRFRAWLSTRVDGL